MSIMGGEVWKFGKSQRFVKSVIGIGRETSRKRSDPVLTAGGRKMETLRIIFCQL